MYYIIYNNFSYSGTPPYKHTLNTTTLITQQALKKYEAQVGGACMR